MRSVERKGAWFNFDQNRTMFRASQVFRELAILRWFAAQVLNGYIAFPDT